MKKVTVPGLRAIWSSSAAQAIAAFAIRMASGIAGYAMFAVIARMSGAQDFGTFSILFSVAMTAGIIGSFGQQIFLVKEVPSARADGSLERERGAFTFSLASTFVMSAIAGVGVMVLVRMAFSAESSPTLIFSAGLLAILYALTQTTIGALRVLDRTLYAMASRDLLWRILAIGGLFVASFLSSQASHLSISVVMLIISLALLPICLLHQLHIFAFFRKDLKSVRPDISYRRWLDASFGMLLVSLISSSDLYIYTVLIGSSVGKIEAGAFFASLKTVELLNMFLMAVTLVTAPEISKAVAKGDRNAFQRVCNMALLIQGVPAVLASILIIVAAPFFLYIFDPKFVPYQDLLRLLAIGMLINALTGATVLILQLIGRHWLQVIFQGGALLLSIAVLPLMLKFFGVYGVAISFIISKTVWNILAILTIRRDKGVDPSPLGLFSKHSGGLRGAINDLRQEFSGKIEGLK